MPPEIRDRIFKHVLLEHPEWSITVHIAVRHKNIQYFNPQTKTAIPPSRARPQVQVLRTCKQIHSEYRQVIEKNRVFAWTHSWEFVRAFTLSKWGFGVEAMDDITSVELFVNFTHGDLDLDFWSKAWVRKKDCVYAFGRYSSAWKALKQVKLYPFDGDSEETQHLVYGIRSNSARFMLRGEKLDFEDCHRGFGTALTSLDTAVDNVAFPHKIRRANGRVETLTQKLDLGLKWNDYSDEYHEKNWNTLTAILRACNAAFGGGEIWVDGVLCWKDNVEQACMRSIEDLRLWQRMMIGV
ncbi:hypothetical protein EAE96_005874 [Botrytis aclada]|nr:hypothetical protein EAE96_005874 [Botrytis aclada]